MSRINYLFGSWESIAEIKSGVCGKYKDQLNDPQCTAIIRMMEEGPVGFEGGMNARKYIGITKSSKATATRDMQHLMEIGAFVLAGKAGGRSTSYQVNL